jgi:hypothetical protein
LPPPALAYETAMAGAPAASPAWDPTKLETPAAAFPPPRPQPARMVKLGKSSVPCVGLMFSGWDAHTDKRAVPVDGPSN